MSVRIMSAVFDSDLAPTPRLIMLSLADHADDSGACYPSIARLCQKTGLKERTVQSNLAKLKASGCLKIEQGGGRKNCNLYQIIAANLRQETPQEMHPAADAPPHMTAETPQEMHPAYDCKTPHMTTETPHMTAINPAADAPEPSGTTIEPSELPPVGPPPKKTRRAIALPENWVPSPENIQHALSKNLTQQEIYHEADQFRDYHLARGTTFKCWDAAWRTWVGNTAKYGNRGMAGGTRSAGPGQNGSLASVAMQRAAQRRN